MNTISNTKSLFSQSIDLTDEYLTLDYIKRHSNNMFDVYERQNDICEIAIYHYGGDVFKVIVTDSDDSSGCLTRTSTTIRGYVSINATYLFLFYHTWRKLPCLIYKNSLIMC